VVVEASPSGIVRHQRRKGPVLGDRKSAGADAVAEGDVGLPLQALRIRPGVRAKHLAGGHRRALRTRFANGEQDDHDPN